MPEVSELNGPGTAGNIGVPWAWVENRPVLGQASPIRNHSRYRSEETPSHQQTLV